MNFLIYIGATVLLILGAFFAYKKLSFFTGKLFWQTAVFIILSLFFGRVLNIYAIIPFWDKILHFLSGFILFSAGEEVFRSLGAAEKKHLIFFSFLFASSAAGIWEIYEFSLDNLFGFNSQNASLPDSMLDMIFGNLSAIICAAKKAKCPH